MNTRQARWFWLAFGYKMAIDAMAAALVHINGVDTLGRAWTFEAILILLGLAGWLGLRWLTSRYQALPIGEVTASQARLAHSAG